MKYFRNLKANVIEGVENADVAAMMERYPETYEPCNEKGEALGAPKTSKKEDGAKEKSGAPKTSDK